MGSKYKLNTTQTVTVNGVEWTITRIRPFAGDRDWCDWFRCVRRESRWGTVYIQSKVCRGMLDLQQVAERVDIHWGKRSRGA